eukprot:scaffold420_cov404-Prasinococcus_capsulatus_cf.AAC.1
MCAYDDARPPRTASSDGGSTAPRVGPAAVVTPPSGARRRCEAPGDGAAVRGRLASPRGTLRRGC